MRLITRADMDGLTSAVLITSCEDISEIKLAHPQDITDRRLTVSSEDIIANLPYAPGCGKWFDHHTLTASNALPPDNVDGKYGIAPSAAHLVYQYYLPAHPELVRYKQLVGETDRFDAAQLREDDVLDPQRYVLLAFTLDPRSGLGAFEDYFLLLLRELKERPIEELLEIPEVKARSLRMREQDGRFRELLVEHSHLDGNVVLTDFRAVDAPPVGNRFIVYVLFPAANISLRAQWGPRRERVALTVGHSIFNRTCHTHVGFLMSRYHGGGHRTAGSCLLPVDKADAQIAEIVAAIKQDG